MGLKRALTLLAVSLALSIAVVGVGSSNTVIYGRDIVEPTAGGDLLAAGKGEDLVNGNMPTQYVFPAGEVSLRVRSTSSSDVGYVVLEGLDGAWRARTDSVLISGATFSLVSGTWRRVNEAVFRDDSTNVGTIWVYRGTFSEPDSTLAVISPRQTRAQQAVYTVPVGLSYQVVPKSWRHTASPVFSTAASSAVGVAGILIRTPTEGWSIWDQVEFRTGGGNAESVVLYDPTITPALAPMTDVRVADGLTAAATGKVDASSRLELGRRSWSGN